jgi:predicted dehydrogenase
MRSASTPPLRVGIIGCGAIGKKRAESLGDDVLVATFDIDHSRSEQLAQAHRATSCSNLHQLFSMALDVVIVATLHRDLAGLSVQAIEAGCDVLVEKPAGICVADIDAITKSATAHGKLVKVGFNHRFHPGIARAVEQAHSGVHGRVLYFRARYGHGGRLGYEKEWRADPALSGGGEIVDQGMHLLDLSYWLLGELPLEHALLRTQFWNAPVDDNAVLVLGEKSAIGSDAPFTLLHVSWTEWKNTFSLEIACERAKLAIDGLVRSYGPQKLRIYSMRPELGPPDLEEIDYPDEDHSWAHEWQHFGAAVRARDGRQLLGDLASARYAWSCIERAQQLASSS